MHDKIMIRELNKRINETKCRVYLKHHCENCDSDLLLAFHHWHDSKPAQKTVWNEDDNDFLEHIELFKSERLLRVSWATLEEEFGDADLLVTNGEVYQFDDEYYFI